MGLSPLKDDTYNPKFKLAWVNENSKLCDTQNRRQEKVDFKAKPYQVHDKT